MSDFEEVVAEDDNELFEAGEGSDWGQQSMEDALVEKVYGHSMTREELRRETLGIQDSLYRMAKAFAEKSAKPEHVDDLKRALKTHTNLKGITALDQAKHAYEVMQDAMLEPKQ